MSNTDSNDTNCMIDEHVVVSLHYNLLNGFGETIDSSQGQLPLVYMHNTGVLLPALERELTGLRKGDAIDVVIYPEDAYGYRQEELVKVVPKEYFAELESLSVGQRIRVVGKKSATKNEEHTEMMTVLSIEESEVEVDLNHPLAGQVLHFAVGIIDVREPTEAELAQGFANTSPV